MSFDEPKAGAIGGRTDGRSCREIRLVTNDNFNIEFALNPLFFRSVRRHRPAPRSERHPSHSLNIYIYSSEYCMLYLRRGDGALSLRYYLHYLHRCNYVFSIGIFICIY